MSPGQANRTKEDVSKTVLPTGSSASQKQNKAYASIPRELKEKDLTSPPVVRLILNDWDRLTYEVSQNEKWEGLYHEISNDYTRLKEKYKTKAAFEIISIGTITFGSIMAGFGFSPYNQAYIIMGACLIVVGIGAKIIQSL